MRRSIAHWINLSPEAILFTILPILIFESSFSSDLHLFMKQIVPVSMAPHTRLTPFPP